MLQSAHRKREKETCKHFHSRRDTMKKKTRQTGLLLSVLMLATTSLYPVSAFAEETTEAPTEAVSEAAEKSDAKTMMTGN